MKATQLYRKYNGENTCCQTVIVRSVSSAARRCWYRRCLQTVDKVWFSDEKMFTVQPPMNTQNDRLYAAATKKSAIPSEHLIKGRKHFSESVMVSVAVSKTLKDRQDRGTLYR